MGTLHHLGVGCADASVIKTASETFLVDCHNIKDYSNLLPSSKRLKGVFITHQHSDHYSGLEYLRRNGYKIEHLIYSPYERRRSDNSVTLEEWNEFNGHKDYFKSKGTKLHAPYKQTSFDKAWWVISGLKFWILGPKKSIATSTTRELHDACLVFRSDLGKRYCTFTGDASNTNLADVATLSNICNDILHASHHGSLNGADLDFIKSCNADYTVISTKSGVHSNVPHPTALKRYRDHTKKKTYRTDTDGSLKWTF